MWKRRIAIIAVVFVAMAGFVAMYYPKESEGIQAKYYVSTSGDDTTGNGSIKRPWKTIPKARDAVRTVNQEMTGDIYVYIRGGKYYLDSSVDFGPEDSGTNGYKIYYAGYPGDPMPRIIGGQPLTGWIPDSGNIYKVKVGTTWTFNRLFENGTPGVMSRFPNEGGYLQSAGTGKNPQRQLKFNPDDLPAFDFTKTPAQLHAVMAETYAQTFPITAINWNSKEISLSDSCDDWLKLDVGTKFYVQGAKEFLDQPGEFFLDHTEGWLYYFPRKTPVEDQEIIAAKTLSIFKLSGTGSKHKVHDITFTGLEVEGTDCKSKLPVFEGSIYFSRDALFAIKDAENIVITKSKLLNAGTNAIFMKGENTTTTDCSITDNWFKNTGLYGINMIYSDCNHIKIDNNLIQNTGIVNSYSSAFTNYNNQYVDFTNNKIDGSVNFAVRGYDAESGRHNNNRVEFNEIANCVKEGSDIAPIHIYRVSGVNNVISNNLIRDCGNNTSENLGITGIYLDDSSCNYTVSNNIIHNIRSGSDMYAIMAKGRHNVIDNNIVYQDSPDLVAGTSVGTLCYDLDQPDEYPVEDITLTHNIYYMPGTHYFYLIWSWDGPWDPGTFTASDNNLFYFPGGGTYQYGDISDNALPGDGTWTNWRTLWNNRFDQNSVTDRDPLFADPAKNNFTLKTGSPALAMGFVNIDRSRIGLRSTFPWPEAANVPGGTPAPVTATK